VVDRFAEVAGLVADPTVPEGVPGASVVADPIGTVGVTVGAMRFVVPSLTVVVAPDLGLDPPHPASPSTTTPQRTTDPERRIMPAE
jgi:hypothetical protein